MAGIEHGNVTNEEFARYECVYNRNSKNFKDKNKKANSWEKIGEKFNLSCLFMNIFRCFLRLWNWRCRRFRTKKYIYIRLHWARFPPRCPPCCSLSFSPEHNARVHLTFPLNKMFGYSRPCDRLRSSAIIWKQLSLQSSAIIWKPALMCQPETHWLSKQRVFCSCCWYIWITKAMFVNRYPFLWEHIKIHLVVMSMPNFTLFTVLSPKCSFGILARH